MRVTIHSQKILPTIDSNPSLTTVSDFVETAETDISGQKAVRYNDSGKIVYASSDDPIGINRIIGVSKQGVTAQQPLKIAIEGEQIEESFWNWDTTKPILLGINGELTQNPVDTGLHTIIGYPVSPTVIKIGIRNRTIRE